MCAQYRMTVVGAEFAIETEGGLTVIKTLLWHAVIDGGDRMEGKEKIACDETDIIEITYSILTQ